MGSTPRRSPVSCFVVITMLSLLAPAPASAVTMRLVGGKPTVDRAGVVEASEWSIPDGGGTVTRTDSDGNYTGTWQFPMPTTIPDAGVTVDVSVTSTSKKNAFDQHTRFVPSMTISGQLVKGGNVTLSADSNSETQPSKTTNGKVELLSGFGRFDVIVSMSDGPKYTYTYASEEDEPEPAPEGSPTVTLSDLTGKTEIQFGRGAWQPATPGMKLKQGDRLHTGFRAGMTMTFPDGSTVRVQPMTFLSIDDFSRGPNGLRVRILLKSGEVKAQINRLPGAYGDFQVKTPTTTASIRGTKFSVLHDGTATFVAVTESSVEVTANNGREVVVPAGKQTRSTAKSVSAPVAIGRGEKRGGLTATQARARLASKLAKGIRACRFDVVSSRLGPATGGWTGSFVIVGARQGVDDRPKGTAKYRLKGTKVIATNRLGKRIATGCH